MPSKPRPLLIIDDNADDADLLQLVLKKAGTLNPCVVFARADAAIDYLCRLADRSGPENPAIPLACFVDIKMSGFSGVELIDWVREHDVFRRMALIVVSGSHGLGDLRRASELGAQCYLAKLPSAAVMRDVVAAAEQFAVSDSGKFQIAANLFLGRKALPQF